MRMNLAHLMKEVLGVMVVVKGSSWVEYFCPILYLQFIDTQGSEYMMIMMWSVQVTNQEWGWLIYRCYNRQWDNWVELMGCHFYRVCSIDMWDCNEVKCQLATWWEMINYRMPLIINSTDCNIDYNYIYLNWSLWSLSTNFIHSYYQADYYSRWMKYNSIIFK